MTLRFLGDVPRNQLEEMVDRLSKSLAGTAAVRVVLDQTGVFLREGQPSVLWLGPSRVSPDLTVLAANVDHALFGFGSNSRTERFTPHVTLGRFVPGSSAGRVVSIPERAGVPSFAVDVQSVVLFESILGQGHPSYVPRGAVALGDLPNGASELY
jgi:2'-5' RNA ligase